MIIRTILFDLDGTLVDSLDDLTDAVNHTRRQFSEPPLTSATVRTMIGKGAHNLISRALPDCRETDLSSALNIFLDYNAAHIADKSRLYPGVKELLETLGGNGFRLAIISNKNAEHSRMILDTLGIGGFFEIIAGGDTFPEIKPSPLPLLRVIKQMGVAPDECIMVGDSINDIQAGNLAGISTVGCNWGYGGSGELINSTHIASSCKELAGIINNLEKMA